MKDAPVHDKMDTCIHEAGHIVMYRLFDVRVQNCEIFGPLHGRTEPVPDKWEGRRQDKLRFGSIEILATLAGTIAHTVLRPDRELDGGDQNDLDRARTVAKQCYELGLVSLSEDQFFDGLSALATELMTQHRDLIASFADALWERERLIEAEIDELIPPGLSARSELEDWLSRSQSIPT